MARTEGVVERVRQQRAGGVRLKVAILRARKVLGWPKRCKLAHAFLWEHSYKRLKLQAQLLGQLGPGRLSHLVAEAVDDLRKDRDLRRRTCQQHAAEHGARNLGRVELTNH